MTDVIPPQARAVLDFWFGELDDDGQVQGDKQAIWWKKDPAVDDAIRERFSALRDEVLAGEHESWLEAPRSGLAYVIVLDQLSRNMYRDTPRMYEADEAARRAVATLLERGCDEALPAVMRPFLYMPLMHSEELEDQARCCELFSAMAEASDARLEAIGQKHLDYAHRHRDIVARFGRFPHRNEILGRDSSEEERRFLEEPGSSF